MTSGDITTLLARWAEGDETARERLFAHVYDELRAIAGNQMQQENAGHTLQPTALVHEVYLRMRGLKRIRWQDRLHFRAMAARVMRQVLLDHARRRKADKRGAGRLTLSLPTEVAPPHPPQDEIDMLALDQALAELGETDARSAKVVELRIFGGLNVVETAEYLNVSPGTVKRDWRAGRTWLEHTLGTA